MKKVFKTILAILFVLLIVFAVFNCYKYFISGNQDIKLSTSNQAYTNSDLYVSIVAKKNGVDLNDTKTKIKFLDNKGKKVKDVKISDNNGNLIISIPNIETGKCCSLSLRERTACSARSNDLKTHSKALSQKL